ncbi:DUF2628 domain-containing protein [Pararhizobium antarcticum]|uniref:DUF2628 domain-containing protein n=1 Tax=Pararhizobium antarcticum TaxID=1798805 RepID=A0A657LU99_9HYPH|nr:DUF2628 domain-containing protein [Pararhizobium antarcticum]OJF98422.1 hypothetical protein AX760_14335 [Pararhizobium antarcticum]OJG01061.1 hypothetical protein AX761_00075 [Rhizobium sp. 58]
MSVSYLVLTPPGTAGNDENARFVADRFSWVAFAFPAIWLLVKRQWLAGLVVFGLQVVFGLISSVPHLVVASLLMELALRLLVALEGSAFLASRLSASGWTLRAVIPADDPTTAEMMYFHAALPAEHPIPTTPALPLPEAKAGMTTRTDIRPGFGLFGSYGER